MKLGMNVSVISGTSHVEFDVFSRKIANILAPAYESATGQSPGADEVMEPAFGSRTLNNINNINKLVAMYTLLPLRMKIPGHKRISTKSEATIFLHNQIPTSPQYHLNPKKLTPLMIASTIKLAYKCAYVGGRLKRPELKKTVEGLLSKGQLPYNRGMPQAVYTVQWSNFDSASDAEGYSYYTCRDQPGALLYVERVVRPTETKYVGVVVTPAIRDYLNSELFTDGERMALAKQFRAMVNQVRHVSKYMVT